MPDREVVKRFIATVEAGRYVEAIERFMRTLFVHKDELARRRWAGDRIVEERLYYDPGRLAPPKPA